MAKKTPKQKFLMKKMGMKDESDARENENETETYEMDKQEAIIEHKNLVKLLRTGTKAELLKEADEQEKELKEKILGGKE